MHQLVEEKVGDIPNHHRDARLDRKVLFEQVHDGLCTASLEAISHRRYVHQKVRFDDDSTWTEHAIGIYFHVEQTQCDRKSDTAPQAANGRIEVGIPIRDIVPDVDDLAGVGLVLSE